MITYIVGDVLEELAKLPDNTFTCGMTSPPYLLQRVYGDDPREGGQDPNSDSYVEWCRQWGVLLRDKMTDDATFWLNIGDKGGVSGGSGGDYSEGGQYEGRQKYGSMNEKGGWCLIPWRVARVWQESGWTLRSTVVWDKGKPRREDKSHVKRPLLQWEPLFCFSKKATGYHWNPKAKGCESDVWQIKPGLGKGVKTNHPAVYPPELVRQAFECSDVGLGANVIDPFCGRGTTLACANAMGADATGIDLYAYSEVT